MTRHARDDKPDANPGPGGQKPHQSAPLTPQQVTAIASLAAGATYSEAAKVAGVDRSCLWRWRHESPGFAVALDETREAMREEVVHGLVAAGSKALATLATLSERAEDEGIRLKAATEVLNRIDGAVKAGTTGAAEAAVVVQVQASDIAAELRKRREQGE
jgi:hypothetical protein